MLLFCLPALSEDQLYHTLDMEIGRRESYVNEKLAVIKNLHQQLDRTQKPDQRLRLLLQIGHRYKMLQADSAASYADQALALARQLHNQELQNEAFILQADVLMMSGNYVHSLQALQNVAMKACTYRQRIYYYKMQSRLNNMIGEYYGGKYQQVYRRRLQAFTDSVVMLLPVNDSTRLYWLGEQASFYDQKDKALRYYRQCLNTIKPNHRIYASAACAMAMIYKKRGQYDRYEHYLLLSAISDQVCGLKENFALQELAEYLAKVKKQYTKSNYYLQFALSDALYYNNRLRLIEISRRFPEVTQRYMLEEHRTKIWLTIALVSACLLVVGLIVAVYFVRRQVIIVRRQQKIMERKNQQLGELSDKLRKSGEQRMQYVSLFIELCANYINEMQEMSKMIVRKVKAHQTDDILRLLESRKMTEKSAAEFFMHFDQSFLQLYPDFLQRLNALLLPDQQVKPKQGVLLNNELRISALIVLGVTGTQQIATVLRYSPQTVYNYRNTMKNKAINRNTFESDLATMYAL